MPLTLLAMWLVSAALMTNQTFPFVTMPQFGMHLAKTQSLTGAIVTDFANVVSYEQREEYEKYTSTDNIHIHKWVNETLNLQENWPNFHGPMPQNYSWVGHNIIHGDFGDIAYNKSRSDRLDILLPGWQRFPLAMKSYFPANYGKSNK